MKKDIEKTDVIFRKEKDGTIIAIFPHNVFDLAGNVGCYAHLGQHGGASYNWCIEKTILAKPLEYKNLCNELEQYYGYNLRILKKRNYTKYLNDFYRIKNL